MWHKQLSISLCFHTHAHTPRRHASIHHRIWLGSWNEYIRICLIRVYYNIVYNTYSHTSTRALLNFHEIMESTLWDTNSTPFFVYHSLSVSVFCLAHDQCLQNSIKTCRVVHITTVGNSDNNQLVKLLATIKAFIIEFYAMNFVSI